MAPRKLASKRKTTKPQTGAVTRVRWPPDKKPPVKNKVDVQNRHDGAGRFVKKLEKRSLAFMDALELTGVELSVALVDDAEIRQLNKKWRRKDKHTDVLSFPGGDPLPGVFGAHFLGDVIISFETTTRQAKEWDRTVEQELTRYLAHGLLHLLGHDHHQRKAAKLMASLEEHLLGASGMVGDSL